MVIGLHHVAVIVQNVEKALAFYRGVFELPDRDRLTARVSSHRGAWFQMGALELHLQERAAGETPKSEQHFALLTDKFDEILVRVRELGGRVEEAKLIEGVTKRCFVYDLDQNRIELLQK
jgi:catechol 2,3-dioxygenase-like lactoylglutathione lyase family enzyme